MLIFIYYLKNIINNLRHNLFKLIYNHIKLLKECRKVICGVYFAHLTLSILFPKLALAKPSKREVFMNEFLHKHSSKINFSIN